MGRALGWNGWGLDIGTPTAYVPREHEEDIDVGQLHDVVIVAARCPGTALTPPTDRDPSEARRPGCAAVSSRRGLRGGVRRHRPRAVPVDPPPLLQPAKTPATSRPHASASERPARPAAAHPRAPVAAGQSALGATAREQSRKRLREPLRRCPRAQPRPGFPLAVRAAAQPVLMSSWVESPVPAAQRSERAGADAPRAAFASSIVVHHRLPQVPMVACPPCPLALQQVGWSRPSSLRRGVGRARG